jgi:hypothetical protein
MLMQFSHMAGAWHILYDYIRLLTPTLSSFGEEREKRRRENPQPGRLCCGS